MSKKHAKFGSPSGLYALEKCPGKIAFGKDIPDPPESEYAKEGTVFHWYMERCLPLFLKGKSIIDFIKKANEQYPDMGDYILESCEKFKEKYDSFREKHAGVQIKYEVEVKINDDIFGTSDIVMWGV